MDNNPVNHPSHYTQGGIECIDAIRASMSKDSFSAYCKGNVIKYLWRYNDKGGLEDLEKAMVYLGWLIENQKAINAETDEMVRRYLEQERNCAMKEGA